MINLHFIKLLSQTAGFHGFPCPTIKTEKIFQHYISIRKQLSKLIFSKIYVILWGKLFSWFKIVP